MEQQRKCQWVGGIVVVSFLLLMVFFLVKPARVENAVPLQNKPVLLKASNKAQSVRPAVRSVPKSISKPVKRSAHEAVDAAKQLVFVSSSPSEKGWAVQLGSFVQQKNADRLVKKLRQKKISAFVKHLKNKKGRPVTRVFAGPAENRKKAEQLRRRVVQTMKLKGIVIAVKG